MTKIVIGDNFGGLQKNVEAFNTDNSSFPVLINAYQWRKRIKRKRGTSTLGRLKRYFNSANSSYGSVTSFNLVAGAGNLITAFSLQANGAIVPGSVTLTDSTAGNTYTDNSLGILTGVPGGTGTINYASGAITISGGAGNTINAVSFNYYPDLPVLGLRDFKNRSVSYLNKIGFDTKYSYKINNTYPYAVYDVSFYKNPLSGTYASYVEKTNVTPTTWNNETYQQFWTVNYQGAMWATNGVTVPFNSTKISMQYLSSPEITTATRTSAITVDFVIPSTPLVIGDFVFTNEFGGTMPSTADTAINFQTGYVTDIDPMTDTYEVTFPNANIPADTLDPGIIQYLTNRSDPTKDCLRWYDGDPTNANPTTPTLNGHLGWVNFCPPISQSNMSIGDLPADQYYLVGARIIQPFKDRLLFIGAVIQSNGGTPIYLEDTVVYSQNGTPYYTASFNGDPDLVTTVFNPILVPVNQTATPNAYWGDVTGYGGFITAGIDEPITSVSTNEDMLIMGFPKQQSRFIYTGNDILPFNFFTINSELGTSSTFSAINMDAGVISRGDRGTVITSQNADERIDLLVPDEIFQMRLKNNGTERFTAIRDFQNEWIYFTYPVNTSSYSYPSQTLHFNYREKTWAVFTESYTTYGDFQIADGKTWGTIGQTFATWGEWNEPWNSGSTTVLQPQIIAGTAQGFIMMRDQGTGEADSMYIQNISNSTLTSPDHMLEEGDFVMISGCLGTVGTYVNDKIFSVGNPSNSNSFVLNPTIPSGQTYLGGGVMKRIYRPVFQTKQFPVAWEDARKTRIGPQRYLLTTTDRAQISLYIYLSQDPNNAYNNTPVVPEPNVTNSSVVCSTVLFTCPESANIGLTPANTNLQMISNISADGTNASSPQSQIWHRISTSLIGDTVQLGFSLSDEQMRAVDSDGNPISQFEEIELHRIIFEVFPAGMLA